MKRTDEKIIIKQDFKASKEILWKALTDLKEMKKWYFENIPSFKPEVGFETQFAIENESRTFTHQWKILEVIPEKLIKYNWKYAEYPGDSNIIFDLSAQKNSTDLKITVEILEDFPDDIPEFKRESCIGGWQYFIQNRLVDYFKNN